LEAVQVLHVHVEQHNVRVQLLHEPQGGLAVLGLADDLELVSFEQAPRAVAKRCVVVDDEHGRHRCRRRSACGSANSTALERFSFVSVSSASVSGSSTTYSDA